MIAECCDEGDTGFSNVELIYNPKEQLGIQVSTNCSLECFKRGERSGWCEVAGVGVGGENQGNIV